MSEKALVLKRSPKNPSKVRLFPQRTPLIWKAHPARDRNILHGIASLVTADFGPKQRRILFEWLNEIEESAPWGPRRRWRHFPPLQIGESPQVEKTTSSTELEV